MSEGRALTNLTGNGIGTLAIARWTGELDRERLREVLDDPGSVDTDELLRLDAEQATTPAPGAPAGTADADAVDQAAADVRAETARPASR